MPKETKMSSIKFFYGVIKWITVEPIELLYVLMFTTSNVVRDNLILDKVRIIQIPGLRTILQERNVLLI